MQGSTIQVRGLRTYAYYYWRTHDFGHVYVDTYAHFYDFLKFSKFSGSHNFVLLKNLLLYIWPLVYLLVLGRDRFFTAYICFKETLFFIQMI